MSRTPRTFARLASALVALSFLLEGCNPARTGQGPESEAKADPDATRGVYEPMTNGAPEARWRHIEDLKRQIQTVHEPSPRQARMAQEAFVNAVLETAQSILAEPSISPDLRLKAADAELTELSKRLETDPKALERLVETSDRLIARFPQTDIATLAAFAKINALATAPEKILPDRDHRYDLMSAAALELGQQTPPHPKAPEILAQLAPAAEQLGKPERALAMYRILDERFHDNPAARFAPGNAYRLSLNGKPVTDFRGIGLDGKPIDLSDFLGKVVLVDFWATWCAPCVKELPELKSLREQLGPKGFEILGVSIDLDPEAAIAFLKENNLGWPQINGAPSPNQSGSVESDLSTRFGVEFIPVKLLIDREGKLVATGHGLHDIVTSLDQLFPGENLAAQFTRTSDKTVPAQKSPSPEPKENATAPPGPMP